MRTLLSRSLSAFVTVAALLAITLLLGCSGNGSVTAGGPGGGTGGADIDIVSSTPASGNTNISGSGVTLATTADVLNGTPVTRVQLDATSDGDVRQILVYFETATGNPRAVTYSWGVANVNDNIVYCPAAGCTGVTVNMTTREIFFSNTALDNNDPFGAPTKFATISVGGIQYP